MTLFAKFTIVALLSLLFFGEMIDAAEKQSTANFGFRKPVASIEKYLSGEGKLWLLHNFSEYKTQRKRCSLFDFEQDSLKIISSEIIQHSSPNTSNNATDMAKNLFDLKTVSLPISIQKGDNLCALYQYLAQTKQKSYLPIGERKKIVEKLLSVAKQYPENLTVSRMIWHNLLKFRVDDLLTSKDIETSGLHPWLRAMLRGQFYLTQAWKSRGGSWAKNVSSESWNGFFQNLHFSRSEFETAYQLDESLPDAAIQMIEVASLQCPADNERKVWLKIALATQPDNPNAIQKHSWFSRPR